VYIYVCINVFIYIVDLSRSRKKNVFITSRIGRYEYNIARVVDRLSLRFLRFPLTLRTQHDKSIYRMIKQFTRAFRRKLSRYIFYKLRHTDGSGTSSQVYKPNATASFSIQKLSTSDTRRREYFAEGPPLYYLSSRSSRHLVRFV